MSADQQNATLAGMPTGQEAREQELADRVLASFSHAGGTPWVSDFEQQPAGTPTPDGRDLGDRSWSRVRLDIVLAPART